MNWQVTGMWRLVPVLFLLVICLTMFHYSLFKDLFRSEPPIPSNTLRPLMSKYDLELLVHYMQKSKTYVEFGSGGSSAVAVSFVDNVYVIEHNQIWCKKVEAALAPAVYRGVADVRCVSPAPISGPLSAPAHVSDYPKFDSFVREIDNLPLPDGKADMIFVDGRFRNACAIYSIRHMRPDSVLVMHDFWKRTRYHVILKYFDVIDGPPVNAQFLRMKRYDSMFEDIIKKGNVAPDEQVGVASFMNKWGRNVTVHYGNPADQSVMAVFKLKENIGEVPGDAYRAFLDDYW